MPYTLPPPHSAEAQQAGWTWPLRCWMNGFPNHWKIKTCLIISFQICLNDDINYFGLWIVGFVWWNCSLTFFFRIRGATLDDSVVAADGGDDGDASRRQVQLLGEFTKTLQQDPQHRADLVAVSENVARPNSNFEEGTWWLISEFRSTLFSDKRIFLWPISNFVLSQSSQEHPHQTSKPRAWWQPAGKVGSPAIATERKRRAYASRWQGQLGFLCEWRYQAMADKIHSKIKTIKLAGSAPASTLVI